MPFHGGRKSNGKPPDLDWRLSKYGKNYGTNEHTHTARLILIEEIKQESAEQILRDFVDCEGQSAEKLWPVLDRAKRLLERGK